MTKKQKILCLSPLVLFSMILTSCNENPSTSISTEPSVSDSVSVSDETSTSESTSTSVSTSVTHPEDPIEDAQQPVYTKPKGEVNSVGKMRHSSSKSGLPQAGEANILVVPIQFTLDNAPLNDFSEGEIENLRQTYFNDTDENIYPSVHQYYYDSSFGNLDLSGVVAPVYTPSSDFLTLLYRTGSFSQELVASEIMDEIYDYYFTRTGTYNIEDFDADKDGKIDAISLVYNYTFWYSSLTTGNSTLDSLLSAFCTSATYFPSETETPINSLTWTSSYYGSEEALAATSRQYNSRDSHEYIVQTGYMLGIDNYFDTVGNVNLGYYRAPLGLTDMMDFGVGDHNAFTKYQMGWIEPTLITPADVDDDGLTVTLNPSVETGDCLILAPEETGLFDEYLMIELYTPTEVNSIDASKGNLGWYSLAFAGLKVYKVDSRLVKGNGSSFSLFEGTPDFSSNDIYDYAFSNNSFSNYADYGIGNDFPLVELLKKDGSNRHMTNYVNYVENTDLFTAGDSFGTEDQYEGFYKNYRFNGDGYEGQLLGLSFTVDSLSNNSASLTIRRA